MQFLSYTFARLMSSEVQIALLLSLIAGLSTAIGGSVVFFKKLKKQSFLSFSMAFAAGVMLYVSFVEMVPHSFETLSSEFGATRGNAFGVLLLFAGMLLVFLIEKFIPSPEHKDVTTQDPDVSLVPNRRSLFKTGLLVAIAIGIHNFPEGIATFTSSMAEISTGLMITMAIAIHNIPEGIAVATPIYFATGSKWKGFGLSVVSGIAEPIGALATYLVLGELVTDAMFGYITSFIAGIMIFISLDFLIPSSLKYGSKKVFTNGMVLGMLVMAISLIFE